jgi:CSLREA domain-containing protein
MVVAAVAAAGMLTACESYVVFKVNTTTDATDTNPGDGRCLTAAGRCSLRAAVQEANAIEVQTVVELSPSTRYRLTLTGTDEDASATGDLDVTGSYLRFKGRGATLDAASIDRVLDHHAGFLQVDDLTITGGQVPQDGAGIRNRDDLSLVGVTLTENRTFGGPPDAHGVAIHHESGALNIAYGEVHDNSHAISFGIAGAVYQAGGAMTIVSTSIRENRSSATLFANISGGNGAFAGVLQDAGTATIINSEIVDHEKRTNVTTPCPAPQYTCDVLAVDYGHGVIALAEVEIRHSRLAGNTVDVATRGAWIPAAPGTPVVRLGASVVGSCDVSAMSSLGFNRFDTRSCSTDPSDAGAFTSTVDQIPVGTPIVCDTSTPPDRAGVARPQGSACDVGPAEQ